ncbi:MAG TPA: VIT1/CCC1 transporter family protein [Thermoplasmata archaeon]|nr:VIT1/CCC1 transporter family protein [Thermoplasmata archaeon]
MRGGHEAHAQRSFISDFILGSQDGLVNVLGILLGVTAASTNLRIVLVATLAALGAETISMAAVAYTSTAARRRLYLGEEERERREMREVPETERAEVREVLVEWGYVGDALERMLEQICANPKAMLEFMMAFELKIQPVEVHEARTSAMVVGVATVVGSFIPLLPVIFLWQDLRAGLIGSVVLSGITLFAIGWYEARTTASTVWKSGLTMLVIGLGAGFAGYLVGHFLGMAPGI